MTTKPGRAERQSDRVIATNRRAFHDYSILETLETGIVLTGTEIKSIRNGKISLTEAYVRVDNDELWLVGAHISPYEQGNRYNPDPTRRRKLLAHRKEIQKLRETVEQKGLTIVPLRVTIRDGRAKIEVGIARGKKLHDKRASEAERQADRDVRRALLDRG